MAVWPTNIQNPESLEESSYKPLNTQTSKAGYTMSFSGSTLTKKVFKLAWVLMTAEEKASLQTFFDTNGGGNFTWTHPDPTYSTEYTVVFNDDKISFRYVTIGRYSTSIQLKEV